MKIKAKAKINLSLNIVGLKDGFHTLESVVTEVDLCDTLYVKTSESIKVSYSNGFSVQEEKDNTVKAIRAFIKEFNTGGVEVFVKKQIPQKAGLGGSSADAVGVVKAMQKLYNIKDNKKVLKLLEGIGSDCPVQYEGGYNLVRGKGEILQKISSKKKLYFVLLLEDEGVDTKECFNLFDTLNQGNVSNNQELIAFLKGEGKLEKLDNALKKPAETLNSKVKENLQTLSKYFSLYNLTGSGSCCYGVTEWKFKARKIYKELKRQNKNVLLTKN